jgi:glycosyltransferase involved in cell wall biosynthesis
MEVQDAAARTTADGREWPSITVVVPTHDRPVLLREVLRSVADQRYPGRLDVLVVFDRNDPDDSLPGEFPELDIRVIRNDRKPGLAGARNTGILRSTADLVAFCDDDDQWLPGKLDAQIAALRTAPEAELVSTSIVVRFEGKDSVRLAGTDRVELAHLLRSRMAMVHSSTLLFRRTALVEDIGLIDEDIPGAMSEDWDILLRAARRRPIVHVDQPLVRVLWGSSSFFTQRWDLKFSSHEWMLAQHPDILGDAVGAGRVLAQMAFAEAAMGRRRAAVHRSFAALRHNWREPRAFFALAVAAGVSPGTVLSALHRHGRGV